MLREIVLDTETTGVDPASGDRIVEVGAVELLNHVPTGKTFHAYINPERTMSQGAFEVHGLSDAFLSTKPVFAAIADELHEFLGDSRLVIHNAAFDMGFLNAEFSLSGHPALAGHRALDTLLLARRKHPGASNSLDALCARYGIDNSRRTKHGALLDAEILAEVYIELIGGRQADLGFASVTGLRPESGGAFVTPAMRAPRTITIRLTDAERAAHRGFVSSLGAAPLWADYIGAE